MDAQAFTRDTIPYAEAGTLPGLFRARCARSPDGEAYRTHRGSQGWRGQTWAETAEQVARWKGALLREDLPPGERVAVMLRNCVEWVYFDIAAMSLGLVLVPLYSTDNAGSIAYILGNCGARVLLLDTAERWHTLEPLRSQFPDLRRVICVGEVDEGARRTLTPLQQWLADASPSDAIHDAQPDSLATVVYTSGTTGKPKGVMLSHRNILSNTDAVLQVVTGYREDVYLSFLPLSHMLERTCGYYVPMMTGSTVAYARSVQDLAEDLVEIRPTMLISVPRVYERIYAKLQQQLEHRGAPARKLFDIASEVGWRRFEAQQHRAHEPGTVEDLMWPVLRHLVADKMLSRLGGRLRMAVSGGAPISTKLMHCFIGLGLPLLQGYGLTESSPIVSANTLDDNLPASVGKPIPGVEVRLGENDELLVRGPNVMLGYWKQPEKTRETIDADGWLRTGDIARIDEEGHLFIVGRLKEILVTSTGEKVPPSDVELAIAEDPLFEQVMVLGEGKPFVSALAVLNAEEWPAMARELGLEATADALLAEEFKQAALERIAARMADFPSYAQVRVVSLSAEPWTTDNGLITPTMKLRRRQIEQRFAAEIQRIYEGRAQPA